MDTHAPVDGKYILIMEDIVDIGYALDYLIRNFQVGGPVSLWTCAFLGKPERRRSDFRPACSSSSDDGCSSHCTPPNDKNYPFGVLLLSSQRGKRKLPASTLLINSLLKSL